MMTLFVWLVRRLMANAIIREERHSKEAADREFRITTEGRERETRLANRITDCESFERNTLLTIAERSSKAIETCNEANKTSSEALIKTVEMMEHLTAELQVRPCFSWSARKQAEFTRAVIEELGGELVQLTVAHKPQPDEPPHA